jgi:hypothetical protein
MRECTIIRFKPNTASPPTLLSRMVGLGGSRRSLAAWPATSGSVRCVSNATGVLHYGRSLDRNRGTDPAVAMMVIELTCEREGRGRSSNEWFHDPLISLAPTHSVPPMLLLHIGNEKQMPSF